MYKPKILIGLTYYLPNISGVTQYALILAEELAKRKYKIRVICAQHKRGLSRLEKINNVWVRRVGGFGLGKGFIMPIYWWESWKEVHKADIVNCHLPSLEAFWLALWGRVLKKKVIITHHCEFGFDGPISNRVVALLSFPGHLLTYLLAHKIVAYTQDYAQYSLFLRIFKSKIEYILPPIKVDRTLDKLDFGNRIIIGYVGRIGWEKGLNFLLETIPILKTKLKVPFAIVLVGPFVDVAGDRSIDKLRPLIEKYKNWVVMYGPMAHDRLGSFYKSCSCLVLPSINNLETFGIVQAEAMVCGCPVVATDLPGVRVPVKITGMGEIAKTADARDLAEKIFRVVTQPNYYKSKVNIRNTFSLSSFVTKYERLLVEH